LEAADFLEKKGVSVAVFTKPDIGAPLPDADMETLAAFTTIVTLENFLPALAHRHHVAKSLGQVPTEVLAHRGIDTVPANGQPVEVLRHHGLDAHSLSDFVEHLVS
jgi:transketolase C-terminal domain/subunit